MKRLLLLFLTIFICLDVSGQGKKKDQEVEIINHEVQMGESVRLISKKYLVDPAEIYKLNKFAVDGISQGMILKIPVPKKTVAIAPQDDTASNSGLTDESHQTKSEEKPVVEEKPTIIERTSDLHTVVPKETLYSISKKYGVTVDGIKSLNPELGKGAINVGQVIKIPPQALSSSSQNTPIEKTVVEKTLIEKPKVATVQKEMPSNTETAAANTPQNNDAITHVVIAKETLYSLSKKYNVTVDDIKQQNPALLTKGLQIGQTLTIKKN